MKQQYFTKIELYLWFGSIGLILGSFILFDRANVLTLIASLIGVTSLIFSAKGNPIGQLLMLFFSALYGIISYRFAYYGEMITYLGMTAPMALFALIAWLRHPFKGNKAEVEIRHINGLELGIIAALSALVTLLFYFILKYFHTANLALSTLSVTTSFIAVALTYRRSPYYALAYAANDVVLIVLWVLATVQDRSYLSVTVCFIIFLINDLYGYFNWKQMRKKQTEKD